MNITVQDFFTPIHLDATPSPKDYEILQSYIRVAKAASHLTYQSIYLIDYYKRGFLYVSDNPLFLCGNSAKRVLQEGYLFYLKNVPDEDLELLLKINLAGFTFYNTLPVNERLDYLISYDFRLKQRNGHLMMINHRLTPLVLDRQNNIWIALCIVSLSPNDKAGNISIKNTVSKKIFEYDVASQKWAEQAILKLNYQEKEILMLSIQGATVERIAKELFLSTDTIKFHKKGLFKKLKANNISEAIFAAVNLGLL